MRHYLARHLKLFSTNQDNLLIRRIGNRFIEFSINFNRFGKICDFKVPEKALNEFIENISQELPNVVGEFRLVFCIVNQSPTEIEGRRIYANSCFTVTMFTFIILIL